MRSELVAPLVFAYAIGSVVAFVAFGIDKRRARRQQRRVPEKTLHGLTLLFGVPGALLAMLFFRHKTRKASFIVVTALIVAIHLALAVLVVRSL
jgi:uncharacterized membrane protein YsdA (DUF1294 family)